jgi:hypothetical protein
MKKVQKVVFGKRFKYVYKNMDSIKKGKNKNNENNTPKR